MNHGDHRAHREKSEKTSVISVPSVVELFKQLQIALFRPDRSDAIVAADAVAVDQLQAVSLSDQIVEGRLILCRREAVARLPGRGAGDLAEDRRIESLRAVAVAADHDRFE